MSRPTLYGADYSVYVRIARLALIEKGVAHDLVPVDIFAACGIPDWYALLHPFGRIPAFEHDGFKLYETSAICRYVDEAFDGPPLQPADARGRATMSQMISLLDAYAYRAMVWDVAVERLEKVSPDQALMSAGLARSETALAALATLKRPGNWLLGGALTLADLHAAAIIGYFVKAAEGRTLLEHHDEINAWFARVAALPGYIATKMSA